MRQGTFSFVQPKKKVECINLDEIDDPYEKSKEKYFIFKIAKADYFKHKKLNGAAYITLELALINECSDIDESEYNETFEFKVEKLFQSLNLDQKKIWKLKNLCNALNITGKHTLEGLANLLQGNKIMVQVMARYNKKINGYYYVITRFKSIKK